MKGVSLNAREYVVVEVQVASEIGSEFSAGPLLTSDNCGVVALTTSYLLPRVLLSQLIIAIQLKATVVPERLVTSIEL